MMRLTEKWVADAVSADEREFRRAVHTVLVGVARTPTLSSLMVMKGGILLAIKYQSDRHTTDIDFSTTQAVADLPVDRVVNELRQGLALAVEDLDYGLDCRLQTWELRPKDPSKRFQTLKVNVGYAPKGEPRHRRLLAGNAPHIISVDVSFNEVITAIEVLEVGDEPPLRASTLVDIVAEKFRAILQQPRRNRVRRQDVYDLYRLMQRDDLTDRAGIHRALLEKSAARELTPAKDSMRDPEIQRRCRAEYDQLGQEIRSALPDFETSFQTVREFYESLPWV